MTNAALASALAYKPDLARVVARHRRLWSRQMPDGILARIDPAGLPFVDPLASCPDYRAMAAAWDQNYRVRAAVADDQLPVARVSFGSAAFGAYLGAKVAFTGGAGWSRPLLQDYDELGRLHYAEDNPWIRWQAAACSHFVAVAQDKFGVCETEPIDGLNLAEALRGSSAYTDLYDHPAELHRLLEFATEFNIRLIEMQRAILAPCLFYQDGLFSMFRIWLPGRAVWISVDAYGLCSPAVFRKFGAPYLLRTMAHFGGGWVHLHSSALHLLPELVKLDGLLGIGVQDDPNSPRGFVHLAQIRRMVGDLPLQIDCTRDDLAAGMAGRSLPGGVMYMVRQGIGTVAEANDLAARACDYRTPALA